MKPFRVVCKQGFKGPSTNGKQPKLGFPKEGEIYIVFDIKQTDKFHGYSLCELHPNDFWASSHFRELDSTFGPAVCEQIEQIIELEETIEI